MPQSSGGVTAFKFRDPEGHPLELLAFPPGKVPEIWRKPQGAIFMGIDHTAISVSNIDASTAFYNGLGFDVISRSVNHGPLQERLDAIPDVRVEVVALALTKPKPHLELLCYHSRLPQATSIRANDIAATRTVLAGKKAQNIAGIAESLVDPDGHHCVIVQDELRDAGFE